MNKTECILNPSEIKQDIIQELSFKLMLYSYSLKNQN